VQRLLLAAVFLVLAGALPAAARAANGHWEPPGLVPSTTPVATVVQALAAAAPAPADRVERWQVTTPSTTLTAGVAVHGADFRIDAMLGPDRFSSGRAGGFHWRQTPNGLVHLIGADVQGDDLDRWPLALFPVAASDCVAVLQTRERPAEWVLEYRVDPDAPRWFYIDPAGGGIVREVLREGTRIVTFTFGDRRTFEGRTRPFAWHVEGSGGTANVAVTGVTDQPVPAGAVAIPLSREDAAPSLAGPVELRLTFPWLGGITLAARVNGRDATFLLDTGTPQIIIFAHAVPRFGLQPLLGHVRIPSLDVGPLEYRNLAAGVVSDPRLARLDGILGYDFFRGHIVHLDYSGARLDVLPRAGFAPPPDAGETAVDYNEGMPLVPLTLAGLQAARFVLDTGSYRIELLRFLSERTAVPPSALGEIRGSPPMPESFLEGTIFVDPVRIPRLNFLGYEFRDVPASIEDGRNATVDFPIDGILGSMLLSHFEWWFDADGGRLWYRLAA
jgi:hypothetical protein